MCVVVRGIDIRCDFHVRSPCMTLLPAVVSINACGRGLLAQLEACNSSSTLLKQGTRYSNCKVMFRLDTESQRQSGPRAC